MITMMMTYTAWSAKLIIRLVMLGVAIKDLWVWESLIFLSCMENLQLLDAKK
jgi:hypothetical protein